MRQTEPAGGEVLANLFTATEAALAAILATGSFTPERVQHVEITTGDPVTIRAVIVDDAGQAHTFRGAPFGDLGRALALAVGALVTGGLNRLPESARLRLALVLERRGPITVTLDRAFETARASVTRPGHEQIALFTLATGGDVH